jgi:chromosome segregation ATPase
MELQQQLSKTQRELRLSIKAKDELDTSFKAQSEKMAVIQTENDEVSNTNAHLNATLSDLRALNRDMEMTIEIATENQQMLLEKNQALNDEVAQLNGIIETHEKTIQDLLDVKAQLEGTIAELRAQIEAIMEFETDSLLEGRISFARLTEY